MLRVWWLAELRSRGSGEGCWCLRGYVGLLLVEMGLLVLAGRGGAIKGSRGCLRGCLWWRVGGAAGAAGRLVLMREVAAELLQCREVRSRGKQGSCGGVPAHFHPHHYHHHDGDEDQTMQWLTLASTSNWTWNKHLQNTHKTEK